MNLSHTLDESTLAELTDTDDLSSLSPPQRQTLAQLCARLCEESECERALTLANSLDEAQAELADEAIALRDMMSERDAAEAALTKERERLDWLAESWDNPLAINLHPSYGWSAASQNIRAAIDAAMKEGK